MTNLLEEAHFMGFLISVTLPALLLFFCFLMHRDAEKTKVEQEERKARMVAYGFARVEDQTDDGVGNGGSTPGQNVNHREKM